MKFELGDKVRILNYNKDEYNLHKEEGIITKVTNTNYFIDNISWGFFSDELELVPLSNEDIQSQLKILREQFQIVNNLLDKLVK